MVYTLALVELQCLSIKESSKDSLEHCMHLVEERFGFTTTNLVVVTTGCHVEIFHGLATLELQQFRALGIEEYPYSNESCCILDDVKCDSVRKFIEADQIIGHSLIDLPINPSCWVVSFWSRSSFHWQGICFPWPYYSGFFRLARQCHQTRDPNGDFFWWLILFVNSSKDQLILSFVVCGPNDLEVP